MSAEKKIQDDLTATRNLLELSACAPTEGEAQLCAQQSIAGSLIVIATILDRVTRHGERVDVEANCYTRGA